MALSRSRGRGSREDISCVAGEQQQGEEEVEIGSCTSFRCIGACAGCATGRLRVGPEAELLPDRLTLFPRDSLDRRSRASLHGVTGALGRSARSPLRERGPGRVTARSIWPPWLRVRRPSLRNAADHAGFEALADEIVLLVIAELVADRAANWGTSVYSHHLERDVYSMHPGPLVRVSRRFARMRSEEHWRCPVFKLGDAADVLAWVRTVAALGKAGAVEHLTLPCNTDPEDEDQSLFAEARRDGNRIANDTTAATAVLCALPAMVNLRVLELPWVSPIIARELDIVLPTLRNLKHLVNGPDPCYHCNFESSHPLYAHEGLESWIVVDVQGMGIGPIPRSATAFGMTECLPDTLVGLVDALDPQNMLEDVAISMYDTSRLAQVVGEASWEAEPLSVSKWTRELAAAMPQLRSLHMVVDDVVIDGSVGTVVRLLATHSELPLRALVTNAPIRLRANDKLIARLAHLRALGLADDSELTLAIPHCPALKLVVAPGKRSQGLHVRSLVHANG